MYPYVYVGWSNAYLSEELSHDPCGPLRTEFPRLARVANVRRVQAHGQNLANTLAAGLVESARSSVCFESRQMIEVQLHVRPQNRLRKC